MTLPAPVESSGSADRPDRGLVLKVGSSSQLYEKNQVKSGGNEGAGKQKDVEYKDRNINPRQQVPKPVRKLKSESESRVEERKKESQKQEANRCRNLSCGRQHPETDDR